MWSRNQLDSFAIDGGLPVQSFRLMIALVASCIIAPSIHLCGTENSRLLRDKKDSKARLYSF